MTDYSPWTYNYIISIKGSCFVSICGIYTMSLVFYCGCEKML